MKNTGANFRSMQPRLDPEKDPRFKTAEMVEFVKMHGAGNDYIYINGISHRWHNLPELARRISDRHFGVGSDGLVIILPSETADFRMRMFNADGSEAQMCGNASRCIGKYVHDLGLTSKKEIKLETAAGIKVLKLHVGDDGLVDRVTVDMGEPELNASKVPVIIENSSKECPEMPVEVIIKVDDIHDKETNKTFRAVAVSMGNPHGVIFTEDLGDDNVLCYGPRLETASCWPEKTNVEFLDVISPTEARMRVWERGSGETLACGTGACASLVAAVSRGLLDRRADIHLPGGTLTVEWSARDNHVYLTGGAAMVAEGIFLTDTGYMD